jgi:hypothetical protein
MLGAYNLTSDVQIKFSYLEVGASMNECKNFKKLV